MIISRKATFFLGIFIFIIPFLGFPTFWKEFLTVVSGISLIGLSIKIIMPKKPAPRPRVKREKPAPVIIETTPVYPSNDTVEAAQSNQSNQTKPASNRKTVIK